MDRTQRRDQDEQSDGERDDGPDRPGPDVVDLAGATVSRDDGQMECTIYEEDVPEYEVITRWITAQEGSFVGVDECR